MALSQTTVLKLYNTVIEDVISGVRESFIDEGVDEQVLQELKQIWETKLMSSKAVELNPDPPEPQVPQINTHKAVPVNKGGNSAPQQASQQQQSPQQSQTQTQCHSTTTGIQHTGTPVQQLVTSTPAVMDRQVPIQITLPPQTGVPDAPLRVLTIQVPASAIQGNQLHTILTGPVITAAMGLPANLASTLLQQHVNSTLQGQATLTPLQLVTQSANNVSQRPVQIQEQATLTPLPVSQPLQVVTQNANNVSQRSVQNQNNIAQLDGPLGDSSDDDEEEEEEDNEDEEEDLDDKEEDENDEAAAREEEPLNSEDDVTDDDPADLFDTDNVVVCQYDKITRSRNKWKFYLKDGIMNLNGKDYVFQKMNGDAEW
ncbi:transcription initiation factor IIA subunit 1 isoform X2 [Bombus vosnesenskii]|uniref:Transcription initiation factor IIA subunit 1 isoform X2 n=4 Tax=Bombus TaxID=28641 RepID=A0A6J3K3S5_9HYME|nr:transcription initiation factor IIA subunit 1 isoform X2 [Bombus terrestris]XP_012239832.1 transcription initiation factor IIA subunit 1 isoform X2 [Bombus impatiens]XP_033188899.1 transcription initiation factor IIA subunit 1 isoform X2 [Bombus vancouverensis nearcticus]XP_033316597.1 transcription initiation factor IIA subunit 1 isoform X2 [Bombus bifarius]XP_033347757.1 transcription initiation factor IIA subunit 1 isoform X2 [Bombus vosnesenskii]XP_043583163.1 transcription initiation f